MDEIEVKILEINKQEIIKRLETLGAKKIFDGKVESCIYDFEDGRLKKEGKILRLRRLNNEAKVTFKKISIGKEVKSAEEYEVSVGSFGEMKKIIEGVGMTLVYRGEKHRISYAIKDVRFEIDTIPNIPLFLEIESNSKEKIEKAVKLLGFSMKNTVPWGGREVIEYYQQHN